MKTGDLVRQFGISSQTVQRWVAEFGEYLTESARAVNQKQKIFTSDDFLVMATIHQLSVNGSAFVDIHEKLAAGYRVTDTTASTVGYDDGRMVPAAVMEQVIDSAQIATELAQVKAERDRLLLMLEDTQARLEKIQTKAEEREEALREETRSLAKQLAELQYRLGQAEGELKFRQEESQKRRWWGGNGD